MLGQNGQLALDAGGDDFVDALVGVDDALGGYDVDFEWHGFTSSTQLGRRGYAATAYYAAAAVSFSIFSAASAASSMVPTM